MKKEYTMEWEPAESVSLPTDTYKGYELSCGIEKKFEEPYMVGTVHSLKINKTVRVNLAIPNKIFSIDMCINFYKIVHGLIDLLEEVKSSELNEERTKLSFESQLTQEKLDQIVENYSEEYDEKESARPTFDSLNSWFDQTDTNRWLNK